MSQTSQDEELSDLGHGSLYFIDSIVNSKDAVDKRLLNLFKLRKEEEFHVLREKSEAAIRTIRKETKSSRLVNVLKKRKKPQLD